MRNLAWLCAVLVGVAFGGEAGAQSSKAAPSGSSAKSGEIQVLLRKPKGNLGAEVKPVNAVMLCPELQLSSESYPAYRVTTRDGAVYGVGGEEGDRKIQRCRDHKIEWTFPVETWPSISIDDAGNVYATTSPPSGGPGLANKALLRKITPNGKVAWAATIESSGAVRISTVPQPGAPQAVYVSGGTAGVLKGQPASSKGSPFVAKYSTDGKLLWAKQSDAFGALDELDVDPAGNVYLSLSEREPPTFGSLIKLTPDGEMLWRKALKLKKGSLPFIVDGIHAADSGKDVYIFAGAPEVEGAHAVMKIGADGRLRWAKTFQLSHGGDDGWGSAWSVVAAGTVGSTLYVIQRYDSYRELPGGDEKEEYQMLIRAHRVSDGRLNWTRLEWYGDLEPSDYWQVGDVFILPDKLAITSSANASFKLRPDGKLVLPKPAAAPPAPAKADKSTSD